MSDHNPDEQTSSADASRRVCLRCGSEIPRDHPSEICPECLLQPSPDRSGGAAWTVGPGQRWEPPAAAELAKHFPQLEVEELLGRGGMGAVYLARQKSLDRPVALKILPPEVARRPGFTVRFTREAQALARLSHANIVTVFDFGQTGPYAYLMMEHVDGVNLRQVLSDGHLTPEEALGIVPQLCDALQFAHAHGVVHRDIKPENILLDTRGHVKIADFGLAKLAGQIGESAELTGAAGVVGTMYYMAPEQIEHPDRVDHRADIYSMGVVFYEMLTGELPLGRFLPPSQRVHVDVRLDDVVLRTLEKQPERRYSRVEDVKTDVHEIESTPGARAARAAPSPSTPQAWPDRIERYVRDGAQWMAVAGSAGWGRLAWGSQGPIEPLAMGAIVVQLLSVMTAVNTRRDDEQALAFGFGGLVSLLLARLALRLVGDAPLSPLRQWMIRIPLAIVYVPVTLLVLLWPLVTGVALTEVFYDRADPFEARRILVMVVFGTMLAITAWWFVISFVAWMFPDLTRFLFRPFADEASGRIAKWLTLLWLVLAIVAAVALMQLVSMPL